MSKAMVAIVGRPNVGKSTLINRLGSTGKAIIDAISGVTRDRQYIETNWRGRDFVLIDTGGIEGEAKQSLRQEIKEQAEAAITESDLILFVVDGKAGLVAGDDDVAKILHRSQKPVILVANK
ncbi:MAG TPA: GTP-binding protein, partial [Actinobacteria bacterium]|nr:GTP-binding protein [Actinomycetes bacterium]HEX21603.1 GTP-binding protein [Actinomycetota bacterium]